MTRLQFLRKIIASLCAVAAAPFVGVHKVFAKTCPTCGGSGNCYTCVGSGAVPCHYCGGSGQVRVSTTKGGGRLLCTAKNRQTKAVVRDRHERRTALHLCGSMGRMERSRIWGLAAHLHDYHVQTLMSSSRR